MEIAKKLPKFGNYHAIHLVRSLTYATKGNIEINLNWTTLKKMSQGVRKMTERLGKYMGKTPKELAEKLTRDTEKEIHEGDIALILCESKNIEIQGTPDKGKGPNQSGTQADENQNEGEGDRESREDTIETIQREQGEYELVWSAKKAK